MADAVDAPAISPQPWPSVHASLAPKCSTFISLPDGFLWSLKSALPLHRVDREFLKTNALQDQPSNKDHWAWYINSPSPSYLGQDNPNVLALLHFTPHHKLLDNTLFMVSFPFCSHLPTLPPGFPQILSQKCYSTQVFICGEGGGKNACSAIQVSRKGNKNFFPFLFRILEDDLSCTSSTKDVWRILTFIRCSLGTKKRRGLAPSVSFSCKLIRDLDTLRWKWVENQKAG